MPLKMYTIEGTRTVEGEQRRFTAPVEASSRTDAHRKFMEDVSNPSQFRIDEVK